MPKHPNKDVRLLGGLIRLRRVGCQQEQPSNPTNGSGGRRGNTTAPARAQGNVYPPRRSRTSRGPRQSRERVRPAAGAAAMSPAAARPAAPPDWATSRAIVLVPNPDGSWVAQPANYWQDGQRQSGDGTGTGGTGGG